MKKIIKYVSSVILGGILVSCEGDETTLNALHLERLQARTTQVSKLNEFYETFEVFLAIVPHEAYLTTTLSRVDDSIKTSIVVVSKPGQIVHYQDLRLKNGSSVSSIKSEDYKSLTQLNKENYGKVSIFNTTRRQLRDIVNNSKEEFFYIDFMGFQYKIEVEKIKHYLQVVSEVLSREWDEPIDLSIQEAKPILPLEDNVEEVEEDLI